MDRAAKAHHAFEEHTSEVRLHLWAPDLVALFEEAALALAELMLAEGPHGELGPAEPIAVRAPDREALLAAWIDELVFLSETRKRVWIRASLTRLEAQELQGTVRGVEPAAIRTAVKAATLHDLHVVACASGGFEATVVLDV
jgi:SHS2 domain-containing protein